MTKYVIAIFLVAISVFAVKSYTNELVTQYNQQSLGTQIAVTVYCNTDVDKPIQDKIDCIILNHR